MSSGILVIGHAEQVEIEQALEAARARPMPWDLFKTFAQNGTEARALLLIDRKAGLEEARKQYPSQQIILGTYRVALSFEEQPAGVYKHISVSSERKGKVPGPEVMQMVCEAFGFSDKLCAAIGGGRAMLGSDKLPFRAWLEEFDPGHIAINVIELENVTQ